MSNNSNYIQTTENVQQPKKYYSYLYEIKHLPTGLFYVGSRSRKSVLKTYEDCFNDDYLGSSCLEEGPFSEKDTKTNPHDYAKTVLKVFHDEDPKKATRYEHGSNGLIMTYWKKYGKDKVLNQHCVLNDDSEVFSTAGQNNFANKTEVEIAEIRQKISDSVKKAWEDKMPEEIAELSQKRRDIWANRTEAEIAAISQKRRDAWANKTEEEKMQILNKSEEEKEEIAQKKRDTWANKTEEEMQIFKQKMSDGVKKAWANKPEEEMEEYIQKCRDNWANKTEEEKQKISEANKGENNPMFRKTHTQEAKDKISAKISGENNGNNTQYRHPYNPNFTGNGRQISLDIKKNWSNETPWNKIHWKQKQSYKIDRQNASVLIES